ncbi:hypothetical protein FI667_g5142, partial [Globisporangium splendens]
MIENDGNNDEITADVWVSFKESVTYMKQVAAIYQETFRVTNQPNAVVSPRKAITKARLDEARQQAHEALELLASNLLNTSADLMSTIEAQEASAIVMKSQLEEIRDRLNKEKRAKEQQWIAAFYSLPEYAQSSSTQSSNTSPTSLALTPNMSSSKRTYPQIMSLLTF